MTTDREADERKAFESAFPFEYLLLTPERAEWLAEIGQYNDYTTQMMWTMWRAARAALDHQRNEWSAVTDEMVSRFLGWSLPDDFSPDNGISFDPAFNKGTAYEKRREPVGTNLFSAVQARAMLEHVIGSVPSWTPGPSLWKDWCAQWFGPDSDEGYLARAVAALPAALSQPSAEPAEAPNRDKALAYYIYIPNQQRGYVVESLDDDEAIDDTTNYECEITPLVAALPEPAVAPSELRSELLRLTDTQLGTMLANKSFSQTLTLVRKLLDAALATPPVEPAVAREPGDDVLKAMHLAYWRDGEGEVSMHWHENSRPLWLKAFNAALTALRAAPLPAASPALPEPHSAKELSPLRLVQMRHFADLLSNHITESETVLATGTIDRLIDEALREHAVEGSDALPEASEPKTWVVHPSARIDGSGTCSCGSYRECADAERCLRDKPLSTLEAFQLQARIDRRSASPEVSSPVTDEMIAAYLTANTAYWLATDEMPPPPDKWCTGTPKEATRAGLIAALAVAALRRPEAAKPDGPGGCGASGGFCPTEELAINRWNARAIIAADRAIREPSAEPNKAFALTLLSAAAQSGDAGAMGLAAQLGGFPECTACGFVKAHCRCASQPSAIAEPVAWACFSADGRIEPDLCSTSKSDCEFWRDADDAKNVWTVRPLYSSPQLDAERVMQIAKGFMEPLRYSLFKEEVAASPVDAAIPTARGTTEGGAR